MIVRKIWKEERRHRRPHPPAQVRGKRHSFEISTSEAEVKDKVTCRTFQKVGPILETCEQKWIWNFWRETIWANEMHWEPLSVIWLVHTHPFFCKIGGEHRRIFGPRRDYCYVFFYCSNRLVLLSFVPLYYWDFLYCGQWGFDKETRNVNLL